MLGTSLIIKIVSYLILKQDKSQCFIENQSLKLIFASKSGVNYWIGQMLTLSENNSSLVIILSLSHYCSITFDLCDNIIFFNFILWYWYSVAACFDEWSKYFCLDFCNNCWCKITTCSYHSQLTYRMLQIKYKLFIMDTVHYR